MSISPITGFITTAPVSSTRPTAQPQPVQTNTLVKTIVDTVHLSQDGQIQLLTQQGQTASQIANTLGVSVSTIDSDLYITVATPAATPATTEAATASTSTQASSTQSIKA